ncbi:nitrous oxide-stimulated promoter family protein [Providencia hangzhouensis]|uniref:nitrous oxide-stimulated promoter family protein n=1 Tax=Providencia hangzhouensis TaxID=3031799 RepID=UPI0034DD1C0E
MEKKNQHVNNVRSIVKKPKMREQMKLVMRWAGPKMLIHHPILAIRHLLDNSKTVP